MRRTWTPAGALCLRLVVALTGFGCDGGKGSGGDVGDAPDASGADGAADAALDGAAGDGAGGDGDDADDGRTALSAEEVAFVATEVTFSAERTCDLDGDGVGDNALAELGASRATSAVMLWDSLAEAALGDAYGPALYFPVAEDGGESRLIALSGDGATLGDGLRAPYESMNSCGEPVFEYRGQLLDDGALTLSADDYPVLLSNAVAPGHARVSGSLSGSPGSLVLETEECLAPTIGALGATLGPTQTRGLSLLEVVLGGGGALGMAGVPGLSPDVDLDGDGLERVRLDGDGHVVECVDGDDTVIAGRDCWDDERMADAIALTRRVRYEQSTFDGRLVGWMGHCPAGYPEPSVFGEEWSLGTGGWRLALGWSHTCLRTPGGAVRCWGGGGFGQLGYANTKSVGDDGLVCEVGFVDLGEGALDVAASGDTTCAILAGRRLKCWGALEGQWGLPRVGDDETPAEVDDLDLGAPVQQLAAGIYHRCALLSGGRVRCWGNDENEVGLLGHANTDSLSLAEAAAGVDVPVGGRVAALAANMRHTCALLDTGGVRCWGAGLNGRLGYGNTDNVGDDETPADVGDVPLGGRATAIAAGMDHTCAIMEDGAVRCWGAGLRGTLGYGSSENVGDDETPASAGDVPLGGSATEIATTGDHTCARLEGGEVRCWGNGFWGVLGYGNSDNVGDDETPEDAGDVPLGAAALDIAAGNSHTCALLDGGRVRCWGYGLRGSLGYGNSENIGDDEPPADAGDVPLDCSEAVCGDGLVQGFEDCDDANAAEGDGCSPGCLIDEGYGCVDVEPSSCHLIVCGDGFRDHPERCDDGNLAGSDGCSPECQEEFGYECDWAYSPTTCTFLPQVELGLFAPGDPIPEQAGGPMVEDEDHYYMLELDGDALLSGTLAVDRAPLPVDLIHEDGTRHGYLPNFVDYTTSWTDVALSAGRVLMRIESSRGGPSYTLSLSTRAP